MGGRTHKLGGITSALISFILLNNYGLLPTGVAPALVLIMLFYFGEIGSVMSDLDHHAGSIPLRDPISRTINIILHLGTRPRRKMKSLKQDKNFLYTFLGIFDAKHRSKQTHSDFTLIALFAALYWVTHTTTLQGGSVILAKTMLMGLIVGMIAHLILDGITPHGIHLLTGVAVNKIMGKNILPERFRLVPKSSFFSTGSGWEMLVYKVLTVLNWLMFLYCAYLLSPWRISFPGLRGSLF